jgi:hypothetical protein
MAAGLRRAFVILAFACAIAPHATGVAAEILVDPTRPPVSVAAETPDAPRRPVLQSIIITTHARAAIIDDERVELHGKFRDAVVAKITETEVVLRSPAGIETLRMYPGVEKTPARREVPRIQIERRGSRSGGEKP